MQQENNNDFITMLIKMLQLESCFQTNYEPFYGSEIDLSLDTFYNDSTSTWKATNTIHEINLFLFLTINVIIYVARQTTQYR